MKHQKKLITLLLALIAVIAACATRSDTFPVYPAGNHYDAATQTFKNAEPQRPVNGNPLGISWQIARQEKANRPQKPLPMEKPDWQAFQSASESRFIWFGHSTLLMRVGGQTIATDPVFGNSVSPIPMMMKRFQRPAAEFETWPDIDVVLISHSHFDHLEEATIKKMAAKKNHFIVPLGIGVLLQKWGIAPERISEIDWWQSITRNGVRYTAVPARHNSGRSFNDTNKTLWAGFIIEHDNERIYYSGDSSYRKHFADIAARFAPIDIAFIENGQYNERWPDNHLFPEQTAEVAALLQARRFVPIHWGAYTIAMHPWNEPVKHSIPAARKLGIHPLTPIQGQVFDTDTETEDWFLNE